MAEQAHSFSETTAISALVGATYTTVHTHAASNFVAGGDYLIVVKAKLFGESTTGLVQIKVRHGSTDFADSEHVIMPATASGGADFPTPYAWFVRWTAVTSEDITVQIRGAGAPREANADQIEVVAMRLDGLTENTDFWYSDVATDTALSVAGIDGASISLTPPAGTDLWVMAFGRVDIATITTSFGSRIVSTGTFNESRPSNIKEGDDATNEFWVCHNERVFINLGNSAQTFKEQSYVESGPTGNVVHSRLFALRLNVFKNRAVAWTAAAEVLGTTAWADPFQTAVSYTPAVTGDSWLSVAGIFDAGNALREVLHRVQIDNTDQPPTQTADTYDECWALDADNEIGFGTQTVEALTGAAGVTIDWEGHTNSVTGAPQVVDRSLVIFSFELAGATGYSLDAQPGSFALAGAAAGAQAQRLVAADPGAYTLTGQAAGVPAGRALAADPGAFSLAGTDAAMPLTRQLTADPGSYEVAGQPAIVAAGRLFSLDPGAYALSGAPAGLAAGRVVSADPGVYVMTGAAAALLAERLLAAEAGVYVLTGVAAELVVAGGGPAAYELAADPGTFAVTGAAAGVLASRLLAGEPGVYALTGVAAATVIDRLLAANPGAYVVTGTATPLQVARVLRADPGAYVFVGADATFDFSGAVTLGPGPFSVVVVGNLGVGVVLAPATAAEVVGNLGVDVVLAPATGAEVRGPVTVEVAHG